MNNVWIHYLGNSDFFTLGTARHRNKKKEGGRLATSFFGCVGKKWVGCLTGQLKPAPEDEISHPVFGHGGTLGQVHHLISDSLPGYEAYPVLPFCAV